MSVFCLIDVSMNYIEPCWKSRHAPGKPEFPWSSALSISLIFRRPDV
jgi:hypothetical protein